MSLSLEEFKADGDWQTIFMEGGRQEPNMRGGVDEAGNPTTREVRAFKMSDVTKVIATAEGENDGPEWVGLFKTRDGIYLFVKAGCDYTGWDCQASCVAEWHTNLRQCKAMIDDESRERLFPVGS